MLRHQHKNTVTVSTVCSSNLNSAGPEKCKVVEAQYRDLKLAFISMIVVLKDEMNKFLKEIMKTQTVKGNNPNVK